MDFRFKNDFEKASFFERCAFKNLRKLYDLFPEYNYWETEINEDKPYDIGLMKVVEGVIVDKIIIEIKIRNMIFEEYILEPKKVTNIKRYCKNHMCLDEGEYKIYFVNFTPNGTYIWNTNIIDKLEIKVLNCNKDTMVENIKKVNKKVYYLPTEKAKFFEYKWDESQAIPYYKGHNDNIIVKEVKKRGGLDWLFEK